MASVYIVQQGCYDSKSIAGVYASIEAAMAAHPEGRWQGDDVTGWDNSLHWDDFATIGEYEVVTDVTPD